MSSARDFLYGILLGAIFCFPFGMWFHSCVTEHNHNAVTYQSYLKDRAVCTKTEILVFKEAVPLINSEIPYLAPLKREFLVCTEFQTTKE
jgi:hypothetical protein